ncbi:unnamed protein product [Malus baccata var. baccata]
MLSLLDHIKLHSCPLLFLRARLLSMATTEAKPEAKPEPKEIEESSETLLKCKVLMHKTGTVLEQRKTSSRYALPQAVVLKLEDGTGLLFPSQSENA